MAKVHQLRRSVTILFIAVFATCGCENAQYSTMDSTFVDRLEQLGFFKYVSTAERNAAKSEFQNIGWAAIYGQTGRLFPADAESLAEGRVGQFLRDIEPFLKKQGVIINKVEDHFDENGYSITVNGKDYVIYNADDLKRDETQPASIWGLATVRGFAIVNELLVDAKSSERLYAVNGGNDLFGFFLTPELRDAVCDHPDATPRDSPYVPKD